MHEGAQLLKHGLHRSVWLDADGSRVRKRFRSRSVWRRLTDGRRAQREARAIQCLARLGLPVPELLGVERHAGAWEVVTRAVPGAESLSRRIEWAAPAPPEEDARAVGELVARLHAAGFRHGDLHPDNLLRDAQGRWFVIDVGDGRLAPPLAPAACLAELAGLLAAVREATPNAWTRALWDAWRAGGGDHARLAPEDEWRHLEREARHLRHASVRKHADRWLRASSRVSEDDLDGARWWLNRRDASAAEAAREATALTSRSTRARTASHHLVLRGSSAVHAWASAARALEHGLPTLAPLALDAARTTAVFAPTLDEAARPLEAGDALAGDLADALRDRGLWSDAPPLVERDGDGRLVLSPQDERPSRFVEGAADARWFGGARG